jgi:hypothetical protein
MSQERRFWKIAALVCRQCEILQINTWRYWYTGLCLNLLLIDCCFLISGIIDLVSYFLLKYGMMPEPLFLLALPLMANPNQRQLKIGHEVSKNWTFFRMWDQMKTSLFRPVFWFRQFWQKKRGKSCFSSVSLSNFGDVSKKFAIYSISQNWNKSKNPWLFCIPPNAGKLWSLWLPISFSCIFLVKWLG